MNSGDVLEGDDFVNEGSVLWGKVFETLDVDLVEDYKRRLVREERFYRMEEFTLAFEKGERRSM